MSHNEGDTGRVSYVPLLAICSGRLVSFSWHPDEETGAQRIGGERAWWGESLTARLGVEGSLLEPAGTWPCLYVRRCSSPGLPALLYGQVE